MAHEEEHGGQYHGQGGLPSAASSMMIAAHRLPDDAVVRGKLAHITPRLPAVCKRRRSDQKPCPVFLFMSCKFKVLCSIAGYCREMRLSIS